MPNNAQTEIAQFTLQQNVCPWGKGAAARERVKVHVLGNGLVGEISLRKAVRDFGSNPGETAFVLVCAHERAMDFEKFEATAAAGFLALRKAVLRVYNMDGSRSYRQRIAHQDLRQTTDRSCRIRPHMLVNGSPVTVTAMGPVYSEEHPRYCPLPIICAVWTDDLRAIPIQAKVPHRDRMARLAGAPYDADDFVLPNYSEGEVQPRRGPHAE